MLSVAGWSASAHADDTTQTQETKKIDETRKTQDAKTRQKTKSEQEKKSTTQTTRAPETTTSSSNQPVGTATTTAGPLPAEAPPTEMAGPNKALLYGGAGVFAVAYGASVITALGDRKEDNYLFIPGVGPWIDLGARDCSAKPCTNEWLNVTLLIVDGVAQGAGLIAMGAAFLFPVGSAGRTASRTPSKDVHVLPARVGRDGYGLAATGVF